MKKLILIILFSFILLNAQPSNLIVLFSDDAGIDPEAQAYFDQVTIASNRQDTINQFVVMLKDSLSLTNLSDSFERIWLLASADTNAALTSLVSPTSDKGIIISGMQFDVDQGFTGDGTADFINTRYSFADSVLLNQSSLSMGIYIRSDVSETKYDMGIRNAANNYVHILSLYSAGSAWGCLTSEKAAIAGVSASTGLFVVSRTGESVNKFYRNVTEIDPRTDATLGIIDLDIYIGGVNNDGVLTLPTTRQYAFAFVAKGLNGSDIGKLFNTVEWFLDAIGAGVIP